MPIKRETLHGRVRLLALLIFALSLPFSMTVNNLSIMILAANWLFESSFKEKWRKSKGNPLLYCYVLYFALLIMGLAYTENMQQGLFELEKKLSLFLIPLILSSSNSISKNDLRYIFKAFILSCTVASMICLAYAIYRNYEEGYTLSYVFNSLFVDKRLQDTQAYFNYWYFTYSLFADGVRIHPIYFAMYIVFSSCLIIWLWWDKAGFEKRMSPWTIMLLVFNFVVVVLLSSRTQLFALIVLGTGFTLYYAHFRRAMIKGLLFVVLIYLLGFMVIFSNPVSRERYFKAMTPSSHFSENKYGEGGLSLRIYNWKYAIETIAENPVLGTGTGDAQDELQLIYKRNNFALGFDNELNPHNQYLQSALELGLIGFSLFVICLAVPAYYAFKKEAWLYLTFIGLFAFSCLTESMLEVNKGIVFYSMFNALFAFHFLKN